MFTHNILIFFMGIRKNKYESRDLSIRCTQHIPYNALKTLIFISLLLGKYPIFLLTNFFLMSIVDEYYDIINDYITI